MEKERSSKMLALVALIVAIVGLTVGFAAYTRSLNITNLQGTVNPGESDLDVIFDNDQEKDNELAVVKGVGEAALTSETGATITNPQLNSGSNPTISGLQAQFKAKGQTVEYKFYVYNNSPYSAYLDAVQFTGDEPHKTCEAIGTSTNPTLVANACNDINVSLKVDGNKILSTNGGTFASHTIASGAWKEVVVELSYDGEQSPLPDGDMKVTFDGIQLHYTTIGQ